MREDDFFDGFLSPKKKKKDIPENDYEKHMRLKDLQEQLIEVRREIFKLKRELGIDKND